MNYLALISLSLLSACATKPIIKTKTIIVKPPCPISLTAPIDKIPEPPEGVAVNETALKYIVGDLLPVANNYQQRLTQGQEWCQSIQENK